MEFANCRIRKRRSLKFSGVYAYAGYSPTRPVFKNFLIPSIEQINVRSAEALIGEFGVPYVGAKTASDERWMTVIDEALISSAAIR